MLSKRATAVRV